MANKVMEQRKQKHDDEHSLRERGICITCKEQEAGWNQDGNRSVRCPACKERYLANRSASMPPSKTSITAPAPSRIRRSSDEIDDAHENRCQLAALEVVEFIRKERVVTVAVIKRAFLQHETYLWSVLSILKGEGHIDYNESAPAPVRVTATAMKFIKPKLRTYNNSAVAEAAI